MPIGCLMSFCGLLALYLIEKLNVINYYRRPEKVDGQITSEYVKLFRFVIFIYAIGVYLFLDLKVVNDDFWSILGVSIFGGLCVVDFPSIIENLNFFRLAGVNPFKYEDLYFEMGKVYEMQNPVTQNKGFKKYLNKLKDNGFVTEEEYSELIDKVVSAPSDIIEHYYKKKYEKKATKNKGNLVMKKILKSVNGSSLRDKSHKNTSGYFKGRLSNFSKGRKSNQAEDKISKEQDNSKQPLKGLPLIDALSINDESKKKKMSSTTNVAPEKKGTESKSENFGYNFSPI